MAMLGFFTFGSMLAFLDLAAKNQIEAQDKDEFPKELKGTKGKIWLYKNHAFLKLHHNSVLILQ